MGKCRECSWKEHLIKEGDGKGGWKVRTAEYQMLQHPDGLWTPPFGLVKMDNGELILMGSHRCEDGVERTVYSLSTDSGDTWSEFQMMHESGASRPTMLAYLGKGNLTFLSGKRFMSSDYGRTWVSIPPQPAVNGKPFYTEGNPLVDYDSAGNAVRIAEIGYTETGCFWGPASTEVFIRWSFDAGQTWKDECCLNSGQWQTEHKGKPYMRCGCEGSLTRAANDWLVATLRTDLPPKYLDGQEGIDFDDSLSGTCVTISKDNGKTWSPVNILFEAGRHHAHLLMMPNGDIVMTMTVRADWRNGGLASYRRGCDALISKDNGLTWNLDKRIILDEYEFYDGKKWFNGECGHLYSVLLDDGRIITVHANYLTKGMSLIRWTC